MHQERLFVTKEARVRRQADRLSPERQEENRRRCKSYSEKKKAEGKCGNCQNPRLEGLSICAACKAYRKQRYDELVAQGLCPKHKMVVLEGTKGRCERCVESRLINNYKLTLDQYKQKIVDQNNQCAICKRLFVGTPCIDHDHRCCNTNNMNPHICGGCTRDILCDQCNHGLGMFADNIDFLKTAVDYLQRWNSKIEISK